jgi:AcrR family transcriptional regulator
MPKVKEEYFESKRRAILDAAYRVAMRKPMHEVSMRDIIAESGYSQGGIYRYFRNLDEVLIALINSRYVSCGVSDKADRILAGEECPEAKIGMLFSLWKTAFLDIFTSARSTMNDSAVCQ